MNSKDTTPHIIDIILDECESTKAIECIMKQGGFKFPFYNRSISKKSNSKSNT